MVNAKDYAHNIVFIHNGINNAFAGTDTKLKVIYVSQFAQTVNYQIVQDSADPHVHGIIIINKMLKHVFLALLILFTTKILINVYA